MKVNKKKKQEKTKGIVLFLGITAVVFTVSTFAWFIGRQEVGVNSFNVEISAIEHLQLSLNGIAWSDTIYLENGVWPSYDSSDASTVYDGHTNSWEDGLVPISTSGQIDTASSRLQFYEKSSFTRTAGGFKILSEKLDNSVEEDKGYVVFDLFVKNQSGNSYVADYNPTVEEEIFLTYNSSAVVDASASTDQAAAGIENSIRVAFTQIGRVTGNSKDQNLITGIDCAGTAAGVTAICLTDRSVIWEPNESDHNDLAISWFNDNCNRRIGSTTANLLDNSSYSIGTTCNTFEDGVFYPTNTIHTSIPAGASVDIYDGFNSQNPNLNYVAPVETFTDIDKGDDGDDRNPFMFLAPNSITKLRVYIYIEGMDIDNMDLAEVLGTEITLNFGFTKQQYETSTDNDGTLDNGYPTP